MLSISKVQTDVPVLMCTSKQPPVATFGCLDQESDHELVLNNAFGTLIERLRAVLGQTKGLASDDIDIGHIKQIMEEYQSDESEWGKFANLLILVWSPGKGSAIHDHANAHCCMKILKGELLESLYDVPESEGHEMVPRKVTVMTQNEVGYISDKIGLHKISNASNKDFAVSLHLYTPPYASLYGCSMYESRTAVKHHVNMSKYYSWQGQLVNAKEASTC